MNIVELLKPSDKIALIQGKRSVTYAELLERGLRYGERMRRKGIGGGRCVRLFKPLSIELYIAMIGLWSIDAVPAFSWNKIKVDKLDSADGEQPAIVTATSGTTGVPKIAVRTHEFLIRQYNVLKEHLDFNASHIDFGTLPVFTLANMAAGMTTILPDRSYRGVKLPNNLDKITRAICSPAIFQRMMEKSELPNLKQVYLGGAPVYPSLLERIRKDIEAYVVYGSTEAEPIAGIKWSEVAVDDKAKIARGEGLLVGAIVDEAECRISEAQEILVSGEIVLKGYLGGIGDKQNKIREGDKIWHKTGDAGYIDDQGRLWLLGRVSQAIHDAKGTLYPFCIECILDAHYGIRGAILARAGERIVVIEKGANLEDVLCKLRPQGITRAIEVKKLPMDKRHNAKIDYTRLERLL